MKLKIINKTTRTELAIYSYYYCRNACYNLQIIGIHWLIYIKVVHRYNQYYRKDLVGIMFLVVDFVEDHDKRNNESIVDVRIHRHRKRVFSECNALDSMLLVHLHFTSFKHVLVFIMSVHSLVHKKASSMGGFLDMFIKFYTI